MVSLCQIQGKILRLASLLMPRIVISLEENIISIDAGLIMAQVRTTIATVQQGKRTIFYSNHRTSPFASSLLGHPRHSWIWFRPISGEVFDHRSHLTGPRA